MDYEKDLQHNLVEFVKSFIVSESKERYLQLASTSSGRKKFQRTVHRLSSKIDKKYVRPLDKLSIEEIRNCLLRDTGLSLDSTVLVFVTGSSGHQDYEKLGDVIETMWNGFDGLISIVPGQLVYFGSDDELVKWLIQKN
jgi:hypothetical protein